MLKNIYFINNNLLTYFIHFNLVFLYRDVVSGEGVASVDLDEEDFVGAG